MSADTWQRAGQEAVPRALVPKTSLGCCGSGVRKGIEYSTCSGSEESIWLYRRLSGCWATVGNRQTHRWTSAGRGLSCRDSAVAPPPAEVGPGRGRCMVSGAWLLVSRQQLFRRHLGGTPCRLRPLQGQADSQATTGEPALLGAHTPRALAPGGSHTPLPTAFSSSAIWKPHADLKSLTMPWGPLLPTGGWQAWPGFLHPH